MLALRDGITFHGIHSKTLNLALLSSSRPLLAENKDTYVEIPHKSGSYLITDPSKKDIIVTCDFLLTTPKDSTLFVEARKVAAWLTTDKREPLVFDDDPTYTYQAKVIGNIDIEKIRKYGTFTVQFRCLPDEGV